MAGCPSDAETLSVTPTSSARAPWRSGSGIDYASPAMLHLHDAVILAEDYAKLRDWWIQVVGLELQKEVTAHYHYAKLGLGGTLVLGIASAREMGAAPPTPRANAVVPQLRVEDVHAFLAGLRARGGVVGFGPSFDEEGGFWYGGFEDGEGNPVWVVSQQGAETPPGSGAPGAGPG